MKIINLDKAVTEAKALKDAESRLKEILSWSYQHSPIFVTLDRHSVMILTNAAFDKLRDCLVDLIKTEIRIHQDKLREFGVEE